MYTAHRRRDDIDSDGVDIAHRAADARATAHVLSWLIRRLTHQGVRTLGQLQALGQLRAWPDVVA